MGWKAEWEEVILIARFDREYFLEEWGVGCG